MKVGQFDDFPSNFGNSIFENFTFEEQIKLLFLLFDGEVSNSVE